MSRVADVLPAFEARNAAEQAAAVTKIAAAADSLGALAATLADATVDAANIRAALVTAQRDERIAVRDIRELLQSLDDEVLTHSGELVGKLRARYLPSGARR